LPYNPTFKFLFALLFTAVLYFNANAQDSEAVIRQTDASICKLPEVKGAQIVQEYPYSKKRVIKVAATNVVAYSGIMVALNAAWYKGYPRSKFHTFNDNKEWLQIDKIGHGLGAYVESKISMEVWRTTGIDRKKRIWLGGMSGAVYQTIIETLDGYSSEWGWSWGDFSANIAGSGFLTAQELAWDEQRIQFKYSFHRKKYNDVGLNNRSTEIFGGSDPERFFKDYNGQTYWLSTNIKSFFPKSKFPAWLNIAVGTGAEGLFGANDNIGRDKLGNITFNRNDIQRYRQWYLAPDIDLSKIKTKHKAIKFILTGLNVFKFPMPSLEYSKRGFSINWLHF
jgi:uncharacterized protein YfiM (DUF2279 family)